MKKLFVLLGVLFSIAGIVYAEQPVIYFSDITDAPVAGWEGSSSKGAAVSVWGINLGSSRGSSYVTVGGENLTSDSDYAEWGAAENPRTARNLQRITFWLNSNMSIGSTSITVTTPEGTSSAIPFYCRDKGNIFFVSTSGSDSNSGRSVADAWRTPAKAKKSMEAGDVCYVKGGIYSSEDAWNSVIYFNTGNSAGSHANGSANNSISMTSYPGEVAQIGSKSIGSSIRHSGDDVWKYWTLSKFRFWSGGCPVFWGSGGNFSDDHIRIAGNDISSYSGGTSNTHFSGGSGGQTNFYFYGNYSHDAAVDKRGEFGNSAYGAYFQGFGKHNYIYVAWNEFSYNPNGRGIQVYGHMTGDSIDNLYIHDNWIHHNGKTGIVLGGGDGQGAYEFVKKCYVYNNIINNNSINYAWYPGILAGGLGDGGNLGEWYIYNNTFYQNESGSIQISSNGQDPRRVDIKNNIFYPESGDAYVSGSGSWLTGSNNCYYNSGSGPSWDPSPVNANPFFISASPGNDTDFKIQEDSPCREAATAILQTSVNKDYFGVVRPRGSGPDIGANEYGGESSQPVPDSKPPLVAKHAPEDGAEGVAKNTDITVHVLDGGSGIDHTSILMTVEGAEVAPVITGTPSDYTIVYNPPADFSYSQIVDVTIEAADFASNGMFHSYSFKIEDEPDLTAPYATGFIPAKESTGVLSSTDIVIHIKDDGAGVDRATVVMTVEGVAVSPEITGTPSDYTLTYNPDTDFAYGQVVDVTVDAADLASNAMIKETYSFKIEERDTVPPYTFGHVPSENETGVAPGTDIIVHVLDEGIGVDRETIVMTVGGIEVSPEVTGTPADFTLTYNPQNDFNYGQAVNVTVAANDLEGNRMFHSYSFTIREAPDVTPPYTTNHSPAKSAENVAPESDIIVHVKDSDSGVDAESIKMTVNSLPVVPVITGTAADYAVTYTPKNKFGYGEVVTVTVDAADKASNAMIKDSYYFTIQPLPKRWDITPPYMLGLSEKTISILNSDEGLTFNILDDDTGVDKDSVEVTVNGKKVNPVITGSPANYRISVYPDKELVGKELKVSVSASDLAETPNRMPKEEFLIQVAEFDFDLLPENEIVVLGSKEGKGTVNMKKGGVARIYFKGNEIGRYSCRIFTTMGEEVWSNTKSETAEGIFEWSDTGIASGTYFVYIEGPGFSKIKKVVIVN